jgi:DedD protein
MEKKKVLLVAISVGVFLVIIIGAAILVFSPRNPAAVTAVAAAPRLSPIPAGNPGTAPEIVPVTPDRTEPATLDAADMLKNSTAPQGLKAPTATSIQENNFYINSEAPEQSFTVEKNEDATSTRLIINVPKPSGNAAAPASPGAAPAKTTVAVPAARSAPVAPSTPAAKPAARSPAPAAKPVAAVAVAAAPPRAAYDVFWVQTGSFSTKVRADGVKENLASRGITSVIENRDVNGQAFYRVRVGPYTSKNEADYWLSLIKSINGFEESQVWQSRSRQ